MSDLVQPKVEHSERSINESQMHKFRPLTPDSREKSQPVQVVETEAKALQRSAVLARADSCRAQEHGARSAECSPRRQ